MPRNATSTARAAIGVALLILTGCGSDTGAGDAQSGPAPKKFVLESLGSDDDALCSTSVVDDAAIEGAMSASVEGKKGNRRELPGSLKYGCEVETDADPDVVRVSAESTSDSWGDRLDRKVLDAQITMSMEDEADGYSEVSGLGSVAGFSHHTGDSESALDTNSSALVVVLKQGEARWVLRMTTTDDGKLDEPAVLKKLKPLAQAYIDGVTAKIA